MNQQYKRIISIPPWGGQNQSLYDTIICLNINDDLP